MEAFFLLVLLAVIAWNWFETTEVSVPGAKKPEPLYIWAYHYDMFDDEYIWSYMRVGTHRKGPSRIF